eukprot:scaffold4542_cov71-Phaeocystis_antarctica.AAC.3
MHGRKRCSFELLRRRESLPWAREVEHGRGHLQAVSWLGSISTGERRLPGCIGCTVWFGSLTCIGSVCSSDGEPEPVTHLTTPGELPRPACRAQGSRPACIVALQRVRELRVPALVWRVLRHAKGRLVHVRSTALDTLTADESRQRLAPVAREVAPATAEGLAQRADVGTGRARAVDLEAADPAMHPEVRRQPSRLPRQQVGKVGTAIASAKRNPRWWPSRCRRASPCPPARVSAEAAPRTQAARRGRAGAGVESSHPADTTTLCLKRHRSSTRHQKPRGAARPC